MKNYVTLTDEQLVRMYGEGDFQAFDILLERHQEKVFNHIRFMVSDEELANDIFQDTFVKAIMAIRNGHYSETGQFESCAIWCSTVCVCCATRIAASFPMKFSTTRAKWWAISLITSRSASLT